MKRHSTIRKRKLEDSLPITWYLISTISSLTKCMPMTRIWLLVNMSKYSAGSDMYLIWGMLDLCLHFPQKLFSKEEFVEESGRTNVVISAYTTAQARLKLYSYLEHLGPRALYADTDSVVYSSKSGEWKLELGVYLGDRQNLHPSQESGRWSTCQNIRQVRICILSEHVGSLSEFSPKAIQHQFS
jgi:hypothetical protein